MAETKLIRDHHLWTRNTIKSLSGFDVTLDMNSSLIVDVVGSDKLKVDYGNAVAISGSLQAVHIDYDQTLAVVDTQTQNNSALLIDMNCEAVTHVGTVNQFGIDLNIVAGTDGTQTNTGIDVNCSGADNNYGINITVPDVAGDYHLKLMAADDVNDYATLHVADTGDLTIATVGSGTTDSNLTLDADGDIELNADGGDITFKDDTATMASFASTGRAIIYYDSNKYVSLIVASDGDSSIITSSDSVGKGDFTIDALGDIILDAAGAGDAGHISLLDGGSSYSPTAASDATTKRYVDTESNYDVRICNYYSTSAGLSYVPLCGYIVEKTSLTSNNEYVSMIAPFDGTFHKILWRCETEQTSGTFSLIMYISSDGTEVPATVNFRSRIGSFTLAEDTTYENTIGVTSAYDSGFGEETNAFSKGDVIAIGVDPTVAPVDVCCTVIFKYDITT